MTDPFGTERLRRTVLATWAEQPDRFREDANSEEDHARGGYRDRVVVELAQNAADAATRAGVPGRLLLQRVDVDGDRLLVAANTGAPLDAHGVASLASLRASAKRDLPGQVGRFGVGFAAVRAVADDVALLTRSADGDGVDGVHFSLARTAEAVAAIGPLADEVRRRDGHLPALRLPFDGTGPLGDLSPVLPGAPWDTVVVLRLRDDAAVRAVADQLDAVGDPLLLALPALSCVAVAGVDRVRTVEDVARRWVVVSRTGTVEASLLADRPVEERDRTAWRVTLAVPRSGPVPTGSVHAPTPTDDPCTLPALLVGTFPLDPSRRRVAPGRLTDVLVAAAGEAYADLAAACRAEGQDPLAVVPTGLPAGPLDAALHEAALRALRDAPVLTPADGGPAVTPRDAVVLAGPAGHDAALLAVLGPRLPALVVADPRRRTALRALAVEELDAADVVDTLPALAPADHRRLLDAADAAGPQVVESLASVLVPLADGRSVRGARGLVVLAEPLPADVVGTLAAWGLRVVHPDAAHPLHVRLGAETLTTPALLVHPVVRAHVLADDEGEAAPVVLRLVADAVRAGARLSAPAWWG
ncbi:ATP-binding protein, partial [Actinotalea sp. AC32]|nr:ATP-binding protein [Actinotalea sp. AC32]